MPAVFFPQVLILANTPQMPENIKLTYLFLVIAVFSHPAIAQSTEKEEGSTANIYEFREPYFDIPVYVDTVDIIEDHFIFLQETDKTTCFYFNYGPFRCHFFAEPGIKYKVFLPDITQIDDRWKEDDYFTLLPLHAKIKYEEKIINGFDLNDSIRNFNKEYGPFLSKQTLRYFQPEYARTRLDSFLEANYKFDGAYENDYYIQYKHYKKAILFYHLKQQNLDSLIRKYLTGEPVHFEIPPYRTFFSLVLGSYFDHLRSKEQFDRIYSEFTRLSINYLKNYLQKDPLLKNDTILELVLLKECYNAFYSDKIDKTRLISFTDSIHRNTEIDIIELTSGKLKEMFTHLRAGFPAPVFSAEGVNGDSLVLSGEYNKLIYLGFCDLQSMQCLQEIEYLKYLSKKHGEFIRIITVLKSASEQELQDLSEQTNDNWDIIWWNENQELSELFNVRAVPMFFLIDKDGKMLRNPAPVPSENFEYILFRILRSKGEI